jgi:DUF1009 family protein
MARRLALVAGGGALVPEAIAAARAKGWDVQVFLAVPRSDLNEANPIALSVADPGASIAAIRKSGASHVCAVGAIELSDGQRRTLMRFAGLSRGLSGLADRFLMRGFSGAAGGLGLRIVGIDELLPELLAPVGLIAGPAGARPSEERCRLAIDAARAVGRLDMGQGVILSGDRVIAAEGVEQTDGLIARAGTYVSQGLVARGDGLILAKALKPRQPRYIDMPAIGPETVTACAEAGIGAIVVQAEGTLLVERQRLEERATARGITIVGVRVKG